MKLGIISDCTHYKSIDGKVGTENHILLRQFQALSTYFSETLVCCPFSKVNDRSVISYYTDENIKFIALPVVGGDRLSDKLNLFKTLPIWFKNYQKVNASSDIVYQRFPNNINIPGFFYFYFKKKKVFGTYTGTWQNYTGEPKTFRFQKWLLQKYFRGPVWVYSDSEFSNKRILEGFSPSYSKSEWEEETRQVEARIERIKNDGLNAFKLITVGTLIDYKNQLTILKACVILKKHNFPFYLTVVGDGPMYAELKAFIAENNLGENVTLAGKKNHVELRRLYREHDFVVQAPLSEGFGKVPIEGLFHGVVPVINNISLAKHITGNGERGFLFDAKDAQNLADTIKNINKKITELPAVITKGREFAKSQTLEAWAEYYYKTVVQFSGKE
ncbi:MAG TPA: glycosyltransferase [Segetibacter sp.]|jgi:glycosyltransferase involved in cell wall biosynthesis